MRNRRAVLDGLARVLDARGLEELFEGPPQTAAMLYDLLRETARGRSAPIYWEICRAARRRGVTPEYLVDRASVFLSSIAERRRTDLYRLLGVPPLASADAIRQRYIQVAKQHHPDVGGDPAVFRRVKEAYEILRDADRRLEYERFWLRALSPFERVAPAEEPAVEAVQVMRPAPPPVVEVHEVAPPPPPEPEQPAFDAPPSGVPDDPARAVMHAAARLLAEHEALQRRLAASNGHESVFSLMQRLETFLAPIRRSDLDRLQHDVEQGILALEAVRGDLDRLADLKRQLAL